MTCWFCNRFIGPGTGVPQTHRHIAPGQAQVICCRQCGGGMGDKTLEEYREYVRYHQAGLLPLVRALQDANGRVHGAEDDLRVDVLRHLVSALLFAIQVAVPRVTFAGERS